MIELTEDEVDADGNELALESSGGKFRPPTLEEVMLDPDFIPELRAHNEALYEFIT